MRKLDWVTSLLARLARVWPRPAFALASMVGAARNVVTGRWPSRAEVPQFKERLVMAALEERNEVLVRCIRGGGIDAIRPLVAAPNIEGPAILGAFHVGALQAAGAMLEALGKPALGIREGHLFTPRAPVEIISSKGSAQQRAAAFLRALEFLRAGSIVLMALDAASDSAVETTFLGHRWMLARGAFALAEMTGAPILPLILRWNGTAIEVVTGDRVENAEQAARWLEATMRPQDLTLGLLRDLLYAEPRPSN